MSNSYISYLKRRNPIKYITSILRPYKRPHVEKAAKSIENDELGVKIKEEPKEEQSEEIAEEPSDDVQVLWTRGKSPESPEYDSSVSLDYNLRKKIQQIPFSKSEGRTSLQGPPKRMYPWQNFTLDTVPSRTKFQQVKSVDSLAKELISNRRKSSQVVKKSDSFKVAKQKEVKINRTAMMMAYPKFGERLVEQARINLSTNSCCFKKKYDPYRIKNGCNHRKVLRCSSKVKYTPAELSNFWCANKKESLP